MFCANCGYEIFEIVIKCPICDSRKFSNSPPAEKHIKMDKDVSIQMLDSGVYAINLEALSDRDDADPLIVKDKSGKINIFFNPDI